MASTDIFTNRKDQATEWQNRHIAHGLYAKAYATGGNGRPGSAKYCVHIYTRSTSHGLCLAGVDTKATLLALHREIMNNTPTAGRVRALVDQIRASEAELQSIVNTIS